MLRFCLALVVLSAAEGRKLMGESDYVLKGAVEEPKAKWRTASPSVSPGRSSSASSYSRRGCEMSWEAAQAVSDDYFGGPR
ncbi:hypothetical protein DIPPA_11952 [Diplonema papillatum]|nr:hypothetical protein DIPPA_11952 [Diplonema papillatum]